MAETISANAKKRTGSQVSRKRRSAVTKRHARLRKKVQGTAQRPRLAVKRSSRHIVELKYGRNRERSIAGLRRVSKPGLRVYAKSTNLPRVLGGLGIAIISTSNGLQTDRQAKKNGVGGEVLAYVW
jgi:ribosomal protein S8